MVDVFRPSSQSKKDGYSVIYHTHKSEQFRPLTNEAFPDIHARIKEVTDKMGFGKINLHVLFDHRLRALPSVAETAIRNEKGEIDHSVYLTIPRQLILLFSNNPSHFKAIIAHELGHVISKDTDIWVSKFAPIELFVPKQPTDTMEENDLSSMDQILTADYQFTEEPQSDHEIYLDGLDLSGLELDVGSGDYNADDPGDNLPPGTGILLGFAAREARRVNQKKYIKQKRLISEHLADVYSLINTENFDIIDVLSSEFVSTKSGENHPFNDQRVLNLKYLLLEIANVLDQEVNVLNGGREEIST